MFARKKLVTALAGAVALAAIAVGGTLYYRHVQEEKKVEHIDAADHFDGGAWTRVTGDAHGGLYVYTLAKDKTPGWGPDRMAVAKTFDQPQTDADGNAYRTAYEVYSMNCLSGRDGLAKVPSFEIAYSGGLDRLPNGAGFPFGRDVVPVVWDAPVWAFNHDLLLRAAQRFCRADKAGLQSADSLFGDHPAG